jgi:hypothetical protein
MDMLFPLLAMALSPALAQTKPPDGLALYWSCDKWGADGWRDEAWDKGGSGRVHFDREVKLHGSASVRLDGVPDGHIAVLSLERPADVKPEGAYALQVWAKTEGLKGTAQVRALAHAPEAGEMYHPVGWVRLSEQTHLALPADSDWTRYRVDVPALPKGATKVFLYFAVEGDGTAWFDELSFAEAGTEVPLGGRVPLQDKDYAGVRFDDADLPANLLTNGGFEDGMAGWQKLPADYPAEVDLTAAHTGRASFRFEARELTGCYLHQQVKIDPRRYHRISLWAKAEGLVGYCFTHLLPFSAANVPIGWHGANHASEHHYVTGTTNGWEERVLVTRFQPQAASVTIFPRVEDAIGTVWIDDIVFQPLPLGYEPEGSAP